MKIHHSLEGTPTEGKVENIYIRVMSVHTYTHTEMSINMHGWDISIIDLYVKHVLFFSKLAKNLILLKMSLNFWSSCLHSQSSRITGIQHYTQCFIWCWYQTKGLVHAKQTPYHLIHPHQTLIFWQWKQYLKVQSLEGQW